MRNDGTGCAFMFRSLFTHHEIAEINPVLYWLTTERQLFSRWHEMQLHKHSAHSCSSTSCSFSAQFPRASGCFSRLPLRSSASGWRSDVSPEISALTSCWLTHCLSSLYTFVNRWNAWGPNHTLFFITNSPVLDDRPSWNQKKTHSGEISSEHVCARREMYHHSCFSKCEYNNQFLFNCVIKSTNYFFIHLE